MPYLNSIIASAHWGVKKPYCYCIVNFQIPNRHFLLFNFILFSQMPSLCYFSRFPNRIKLTTPILTSFGIPKIVNLAAVACLGENV